MLTLLLRDDLPQFKCVKLVVRDGGKKGKTIGEKIIEDFYTGKYARFLAKGPRSLFVRIKRLDGPNAILSGIFVDELKVVELPEVLISYALRESPEVGDVVKQLDRLGRIYRNDSDSWEVYLKELESFRELVGSFSSHQESALASALGWLIC